MKFNSILAVIIVAIFAHFFSGPPEALCQTSTGPGVLLERADRCRKALYGSPKKMKYRHHWLKCIRSYERVYTRFPKSDQAPWAIYQSAGLFTGLYRHSGRTGDVDQALRLYTRLTNEYPTHRLADDGQYKIAEILYRYKKNPARAYEEARQVAARFPSGDMVPRARKMARELASTLNRGKLKTRTSKEAVRLLKDANNCRRSLYASENKKKYRHNWLKCIRYYERIYIRFPHSDPAAWAIYHSAKLFTGLFRRSGRDGDLDQAVDLYRRLTESYAYHRLADDAQYKIGEIYYKYKKEPSKAYVEFLKVDIQFPSGDMRPKAKKMLDALAITLSQNEERNIRGKVHALRSKLVPVKDIRHWSTPNYTRVVVDLGSPVKYDHHLLRPDPDLKKPRRLYLDLKNAQVTSQIDTAIPIKDGLLQRARAGQYTKDVVRVVLDMESIGGYKVFHLHDPFRIVVDVRRVEKDNGEPKRVLASQNRPARAGIQKAKDLNGKVSLARQLGLNVKKIVIDPGHGGKDPGCNSYGDIKEKNIVLHMAKILADRIRNEVGCQVVLTREEDVFLSLEQRTAIANMNKADLFISLHINAHKNKKLSGLETYFLNMATDERAVMVAARENATSEKNLSDLQTILSDLMLNTKIHESSRLAHAVQAGMISSVTGNYNPVRNLGVKQAPFYVLIGAQMPAILVETGFLSNHRERKRLLTRQYQEKVAEGICKGITSYIQSIDEAYLGG